ncbi:MULTISPECIES: WXG100 family type VII secretion target [unclassified Nocardia]|uniref:WXG100 family type VII secretion target n=1 Tax=unclassified Nocardia TaxID=2637762 RepID=UPI001CE4B373|nr:MULTISPECIES: hypothetical protein [unclassified Nocardia]
MTTNAQAEPPSIADIQKKWTGFQLQARRGQLKFQPQAALQAVQATNTALGWVLGVQKRLDGIRLKDLNALTSGIGLAGQFNEAAKNLGEALRAHHKILEQMAHAVGAAGKAYPGVDQYSAVAFDHLKPEVPHIDKTHTSIDDYRADHPSNPLQPWEHRWQRHNWAPAKGKDIRPLDTVKVSAEPPQRLAWPQLHALTEMDAAPIRDAGGEWRAMSTKLEHAFGKLAKDIAAVGGDWEGAGHTKLKDAVDEYIACTRTLTHSMTLMGENLLYAAEWVDTTRTRMPLLPHPPTRSCNMDHAESSVGINPTYGARQTHHIPGNVSNGDKVIRVTADGETFIGSPVGVRNALLQHYQWNFWNWYVRGLTETTRNVPKIPLPKSTHPPVGKPRDGAHNRGGPRPRWTDPGAGGRPNAVSGPRQALPRKVSRTHRPHTSDAPRPEPKPGARTGEKASPATQSGATDPALQAAQQALQSAQQAGQLRPASADPLSPGIMDAAKAGLGGPGKIGGPGPGGPLGVDALPAREAAQAKLFPRASLAAGGIGGLAAATPIAGSPGMPGAAGAPMHGAGHHGKEQTRPNYLNSTKHFDEALGRTTTVAPVLE